jgi:hypothetical protein
MSLYNSHLSGYLYALDAASQSRERKVLVGSANLSEQFSNLHGWLVHTYHPTQPIPGVDSPAGGTLSQHQLVFRWGRERVLILSTSHKIVRFFVDHEIPPVAKIGLRQTELLINELVTRILDYRPPMLPSALAKGGGSLEPDADSLLRQLLNSSPQQSFIDSILAAMPNQVRIADHLRALVASGRAFDNSQAGRRELLEHLKACEVAYLLRSLIGSDAPVSFVEELSKCVTNQQHLIGHLAGLIGNTNEGGVADRLREIRNWVIHNETVHLLGKLVDAEAVSSILQELEAQEGSEELIGFLARLVVSPARTASEPLRVDQIVPAILKEQRMEEFRQLYDLGHVVARTDAFGDNLHSVAFYGKSVQRAGLIQENKKKLTFSGCTLRRRGTDILRLGKDGFISFTISSDEQERQQRFAEVDSVIRKLIQLLLVY